MGTTCESVISSPSSLVAPRKLSSVSITRACVAEESCGVRKEPWCQKRAVAEKNPLAVIPKLAIPMTGLAQIPLRTKWPRVPCSDPKEDFVTGGIKGLSLGSRWQTHFANFPPPSSADLSTSCGWKNWGTSWELRPFLGEILQLREHHSELHPWPVPGAFRASGAQQL